MNMEQDWRNVWHIGYDANRSFHLLQVSSPPMGDVRGAVKCPDCGYWNDPDYICPCHKDNADDLRYYRDKEDSEIPNWQRRG